ncbi:MAG: FAD-dependent oxidoreductase [Chloroflexi bacterium]|nr:FAD-dependent oxidoreductase [Chloroflexota bacterium]
MSRPVRVLMLGGGYVAIGLLQKLRPAIKRGAVEVTVISRENYHVFHGFVPDMVTGRISADQILSPNRRIFKPARIHVAEIEAIDLQARRVTTSRKFDGRSYELEYDHLVIGLGSRDHLEAYPGLAEHAFRLKTFDDSFQLRNHILTMLELAAIETDPGERRRLLTFFIAGGGYAGTEIAAALCEHLHSLIRRDYPAIRRDECRVVLVHPGATILPELAGTRGESGDRKAFPRLVAYATRHLQRMGVELMTETRVVWTTPGEVGLSNGQRIPARTIISAVGTRPARLIEQLLVAHDAGGRLLVDDSLQVKDQAQVWAGGDCAAVPHPSGGVCPPVAVYALEHGKTIGQNILNTIQNQPPAPFRFVSFGQGVAIGRRHAVAEVKGFEMQGRMAWIIGRLLLLMYVPSPERRLRLLIDWLMSWLWGRNAVETSAADADDYEITHHVFQPGETIVEQGQRGRYIYLIAEGEVEQIERSAGHETIRDTLGPGERFGYTTRQAAAPQTIRARTTVRVVTIPCEQAAQLQQLLAPLTAAK